MLDGKVTDYGDLLHVEQWLIKGRRRSFHVCIGVPRDTTPADRKPGLLKHTIASDMRKVLAQMDLQADKKVTLTVEWTDEMGNAADAPDSGSVTFTVDSPDLLNLTDNGDGTAVVAATGRTGRGNVHVDCTAPGMPSMMGDMQIVVVAGLAERINIVAGEPEEVTPDA